MLSSSNSLCGGFLKRTRFHRLAFRGLSQTSRGHQGSNNNKKISSSSSKEQHMRISGFSQFSSSYDVVMAVNAPHLQVTDITRELDRVSLYPTGSWIVSANLSSGHSSNYSSPIELLRTHLMNKFNRRLSVSTVHKGKMKQVVTEHDYNITPSTLRLRNVPFIVGIEELKFLFRDYEMSKTRPWERFSVKKNPKYQGEKDRDYQWNNWFVRFASPAEAERAYMNLEGKNIAGKEVIMFLYS